MQKSHPFAVRALLLALLLLTAHLTARASNSLGATSTLVGHDAGSDSALVVINPPNTAWTAVANDPWLHTSAAGTNSAAAAFTFDANPGATRTGTLTIAGQTFTVTQAGASYQRTTGFGNVSTPGVGFYASLTSDAGGNVYVADHSRNTVYKYVPSTQSLSVLFTIEDPKNIRADASGNIYILSPGYRKITKYTAATQTFSDVFTSTAGLQGLDDFTLDPNGNIYLIAVQGGSPYQLFKYAAATQQITVASASPDLGYAGPVAADANGDVYIADFGGQEKLRKYIAATGALIDLGASSEHANTIAVDGHGNLYYGSNPYAYVRKRTPAGVVTTLADNLIFENGYISPAAITADASGHVYFSDLFRLLAVLPNVYVDTTAKSVSSAPGFDLTGPYLPSTFSLSGGFGPIADVPWLIGGSVTGSRLAFSFQGNNSSAQRTGNLYVVGVPISVTQGATFSLSFASTPLPSAANPLASGAFVPAPADHTIDFGAMEVGTPITKTFTLANLGATGLINVAVDVISPGDAVFSVQTPPPATLAGNSSATFVIAYNPAEISSDKAVIRVTSSDPGAPVIYYGVAGRTYLPPVAEDDSAFVTGAAPVTIDVVSNDTDPDGDAGTLQVTSVTQPSLGRTAIVNGGKSITYTPRTSLAAFPGVDTFSYTLTNSRGLTDIGDVAITNPYYRNKGSYDATLNRVGGSNLPQGLLSFTLNGTGLVTGSLNLLGAKYSFAASFDQAGVAPIFIPRKNTTGISFLLTLQSVETGNITVTGGADGIQYTGSTGPRAQYNSATNPAPSAGYYTVRIIPPAAPTGSTAAATATVTAGKVTGVSVNNQGSGYVAPPRVTIMGSPGTGATATATVSGGAVTAINIINGGKKYPASVTVSIDPPSAGLPRGFGYATLTVKDTGAASIAGKLPDGAAFSGSATVAPGAGGPDGFSFYATVYKKPLGFLAGDLVFRNKVESDCDGQLTLFKPEHPGDAAYAGGFQTSLLFEGARYAAAANQQALTFTNPTLGAATVTLADGNLAAPLVRNATVSDKNVVTVAAPNTEKLALTLTASSGLFKGSFLTAPPKGSVSLFGVLYQKGNEAVGQFVNGSQAGSLLLTRTSLPAQSRISRSDLRQG